jgi:hypothetical protein
MSPSVLQTGFYAASTFDHHNTDHEHQLRLASRGNILANLLFTDNIQYSPFCGPVPLPAIVRYLPG